MVKFEWAGTTWVLNQTEYRRARHGAPVVVGSDFLYITAEPPGVGGRVNVDRIQPVIPIEQKSSS